MLRTFAACVTLALFAGCSPAPQSSAGPVGTPAPARAGRPLDAAAVAARIAKVQAASITGDQAAVRKEMEGFQDEFRRSIKLADPGRPIDPEGARAAAKRVAGVHSAVWIDRQNLLALVNRNEQRNMGTIDAICHELSPLGDTLGVVVHLQSRAARDGDELETINRNCQLAEGDRGFLQANRQLDVIPKSVRAEHLAQKAALDEDARQSQQRADEALRLIEASTPQM